MSFNDFIREPEKNEYTEKFIALMKELNPKGILEQTFATETMGAIWRLRRCGLVESGLALTPGAPIPWPPDPAIPQSKRSCASSTAAAPSPTTSLAAPSPDSATFRPKDKSASSCSSTAKFPATSA